MKVLVTGSSGFIGKYVAAELARCGHEMVPFDRPLDIRRPQDLISHDGVEGVINLAGMLGTSELFARDLTQEALSVNIAGALNVFDFAKENSIPVVQIGTGHRGQPNVYALTKACAEDFALARAQWRGEKIAVVRAYHVYGGGQKACPPHGGSPVRKIIPSFVCRALTGMPLEIYGDGNQLIDLVHASSVASVLVDALNGPYGEVTEAGTGVPTTVTQCARDVIASVNTHSHISYIPGGREGEPLGARVVAGSPACMTPWPFQLAQTVDWYRGYLSGHQ